MSLEIPKEYHQCWQCKHYLANIGITKGRLKGRCLGFESKPFRFENESPLTDSCYQLGLHSVEIESFLSELSELHEVTLLPTLNQRLQ